MPQDRKQPEVNPEWEVDKNVDLARDYVSDPEKTDLLLDKAMKKARRYKARLGEVRGDLTALVRMVKAWMAGRYREAPVKTIMLAIAAIVYFVNPFDVIPDFLTAVGFLDDATVLAFVLNAIRHDIHLFTEWEKETGEPVEIDENE
jgi:uncharacterized membrane protein YkvA (DUF1232 family)